MPLGRTRKTHDIRALINGLARARPNEFQAFLRLQQYCDDLRTDLETLTTSVSSSSSSSSSSEGITTIRTSVTGDIAVDYPAGDAGSVYLYIFEIDAVGSHTITLPATFKVFGGAAFDLSDYTEADTVSSFLAYKNDAGDIICTLIGQFGGIDGIGTGLVRSLIIQHEDPPGTATEFQILSPSGAIRIQAGVSGASGINANLVLKSNSGSLVSLNSAESTSMVIGRDDSLNERFSLGINSDNNGGLKLVSDTSGRQITLDFSSNDGPTLLLDGGSKEVLLRCGDGSLLSTLSSVGEAMSIVGTGAITPFASNTHDLGSSSLKYRDLYIAGDAVVGDAMDVGGDLSVSGDIDMGSSVLSTSGGNLHVSSTLSAANQISTTGSTPSSILSGIPFSSVAGLYVGSNKVVGTQESSVADASGGSTIDAEARTALNSLLAKLRSHGLIA